MGREGKGTRSGKYVEQDGYTVFLPNGLPPDPPIAMDDAMATSLANASLELGRLDSYTRILPNPDLFVMMYVKKEAVLSSQIEGTQASLMDVLEFEARALEPDGKEDVKEVVNYISSLHYGLEKVRSKDIDLPLLKEMHRLLLTGTRGDEREPGTLRSVQNWVGPHGCDIRDAIYVPPPPKEMMRSLKQLLSFSNGKDRIPALIKIGMIHSQFQTIHPFLDGNGRIGRTLITMQLVRSGHLERPILYLSHYFKQRRLEYYDRLQAVRDRGEWEEWIMFFLEGVRNASIDANSTSQRIIELRNELIGLITNEFGNRSGAALILLDDLFEDPLVTVSSIIRSTGLSFPSASGLASRFEDIGILKEVTGQKRNRIFEFERYVDILNEGI